MLNIDNFDKLNPFRHWVLLYLNQYLLHKGVKRESQSKVEDDNACQSEMQKRVDTADISVLIFLLAVLIFWLYIYAQTKYKHCDV